MVFFNYCYRNSNIDVWDLFIGVRFVFFIFDWKFECMMIFGNCFVVVKVDKLGFMMLRLYIFGCVDFVVFDYFFFKSCLLESNL